jgi:hypothetical protein
MVNPIGVAEIAGPTESNNVRPNPSTASKPIGTLVRGTLVPVFDRVGEGDTWLGISAGGEMWTAEFVDGVSYAKFYPFNSSLPVQPPAKVTAEMKRIQAQIEAGKQVSAPSSVASVDFMGWIKTHPLPTAGIAVGVAGLLWMFLRKK